MKQEKSCGAVVYRVEANGELQLLLLRHRHGGHWSFPKGHVEDGESEEQTALREIREETGLSVSLRDSFRHAVEYSPKPGVQKQVVYFLGLAGNEKVVRQIEEISEIRWIEAREAYQAVTFRNDRGLIVKALEYLKKQEQ
ncbi:MAG: NUDIX domain-containing protein [Oscillospiraceae bacterium]